jgi:hypothetical protein
MEHQGASLPRGKTRAVANLTAGFPIYFVSLVFFSTERGRGGLGRGPTFKLKGSAFNLNLETIPSNSTNCRFIVQSCTA